VSPTGRSPAEAPHSRPRRVRPYNDESTGVGHVLLSVAARSRPMQLRSGPRCVRAHKASASLDAVMRGIFFQHKWDGVRASFLPRRRTKSNSEPPTNVADALLHRTDRGLAERAAAALRPRRRDRRFPARTGLDFDAVAAAHPTARRRVKRTVRREQLVHRFDRLAIGDADRGAAVRRQPSTALCRVGPRCSRP